MNKNIVLMVALVTNFCVAGLTAGDPFIEQVAEICPLMPTAYCLRSLQAVTIHKVGLAYGSLHGPRATEMRASFFYKKPGHQKRTKRIFSYYVCDDCGACLKTMMDASSHFYNNSFVIKSKPGGYLNPTDHPKNPALEKLAHVDGTPLGDKYTCNVCASGTPMHLFDGVRHVESHHPDEAQERYKQQLAALLELAHRRTAFIGRASHAQSRLRKPLRKPKDV